jgi:TolB-like protein/cytochrome c-type biogenesis protein CcmH/NrfG
VATPPSILEELKRRKVARVALVYAATGFAVLEAADLIVPRLGLPDWTVTLLLVLALLGYPIALALAWAFDLTPEGVRPERPASERAAVDATGPEGLARGSWVGGRTLVVTGVMLAIGLALGAGWFAGSSMAGGRADGGHRVAVLPLRDMNPDGSNAILAAGVQEDLLTRLSRIGELSIISRTSVEEYAGTRKSIPEIAAELGATAIIEGGVQRAGDLVRINVQLIDGRSDEHLWAETFDRPWSMDNLFSIQSEIAEAVATALQAALSPDERARIADRPTENEEAFDLYVKAREAYSIGGSGVPAPLHQAVAFAQGAVDADSTYAEAYAVLALAHAFLFWIQEDRTQERLDRAQRAANTAVALDPDLPEGYVALGHIRYWGYLDYEGALAQFARAERLDPAGYELAIGVGSVYRRQGRMLDALASFLRAREVSPREPGVHSVLGETYGLLGRFSESDSAWTRATRLDPSTWFYRAARALHRLALDGDTARARADTEAARRLSGDPAELSWNRVLLARLTRDPAAEERAVAAIPDSIGFNDQYYVLPTALLLGEALQGAGGRETEALAAYRRAAGLLERWVEARPDDERAWSALGRAYAGMGRREAAVDAARRGLEVLPVEREAWRGAVRADDLARVYVRVGRGDDALEILEDLMSRPVRTVVSPALLRLDPEWGPIRAEPRFRRLLSAPTEWSP